MEEILWPLFSDNNTDNCKCILFLSLQLRSVQEELKVRYTAQHIWTGSELYQVDSDGLIQVNHMTCNPYMVETLLARQEILYKELVECEEDDIARPSKTLVRVQ